MKEKVNRTDVGVICGRFHIHTLHSEHVDLIQSVIDRHDRVIIILGNSLIRNTVKNPLDFRCRRVMISERFPSVEIHYINDVPDDDLKWSKNLDKLIQEHITPTQTVTLYGSRDSFIKSYKGKFQTCELEATTFISATEVRRSVCNNYPATMDYRAGLIAATTHRYPTAYQTVDVAIIKSNGDILLARKPDESKLRFIGGFSDPKTASLELDVKREVSEEAKIEVDDIRYIGSTLVDDPRYRGEVDKIKTAFFIARYIFGTPEGADDVAEVKWVNINNLRTTGIERVHSVLVDILFDKFVGNKELYGSYVKTI